MKATFTGLGLVAGLAVALGACGSSAMPTARVASSEAAVRSAHEVGADAVPEAALHVRMAEDQLRTANKLIKDDEPEKADMFLKRSQADAELAIGITRATKAKEASDAAQTKLQSIGAGAQPAPQQPAPQPPTTQPAPQP